MLDSLLNDDKYVDFKKAFANGAFSLNFNALLKEIKGLHVTRSVRSLDTHTVLSNTEAVVAALINNQITRSRIVEIKMNVSDLDLRIHSKIESLSKYLLSKYADDLKSLKLTQAERKNYVLSLFSFFDTCLYNIDVLQKFSDLVINDIDQASWMLKSIIDCLKINDAVVKNSV